MRVVGNMVAVVGGGTCDGTTYCVQGTRDRRPSRTTRSPVQVSNGRLFPQHLQQHFPLLHLFPVLLIEPEP